MREEGDIRLGNQTSFSAPQFDTPLNFAIQNRFAAFEFFPDKKESGEGWGVGEISKETRWEIKKKTADISLSLHLPWQANPLKDDFETLLSENMLFARETGVRLVLIHLYAEEGIDPFILSILPIIRETEAAGIRLAIENTPFTSPGDFNLLFEKIEEREDIPSDHIGMCLDIGHANLHKTTRNDYLGYIDSLSSKVPIIHVHLHENYGDSDSHLTLFTGPSRDNHAGVWGLVKRLRKREFEGALILEQWPEPPSLLVDAVEKLKKIILPDPGAGRPAEEERKVTLKEGDDCLSLLFDADRESRNWREKLGAVLTFLTEAPPSSENITAIAIYLTFIGRGEVKLSEDGGHFRPDHHARTARKVEKRLADIASSENYFILQKIYPWLPSHDKKFTCAEPLTHIRDIAHRNDIPRELKDEIKHTLQNKLHRCAGPEDLVTSERILKKITAPDASLSPSFVREFTLFHYELKEFFNAQSLEERLEKIIVKGDFPEPERVREFISLQGKQADTFNHLVILLDELTKLRRLFFSLHWNRHDERAQQFRLADIALYGYAFVVASRMNNSLLESSGVEIEKVLAGLSLIVENIELNKVYPEESRAVLTELCSLSRDFSLKRRDNLLRLKASLERIIRITDAHAERVLCLFQKQAKRVGKGLNVEERAVKFFSEGIIRADLIFQLAKYASSLLKTVKSISGLPAWEVLFPGKATGRFIDAGEKGFSPDYHEDVILLASRVSGEEELPRGVTGVILTESIPLLSHLGIRAREHGVLFVICEEEELLHKFSASKGKVVELVANETRIDLKPFSGPSEKGAVTLPPVRFAEPLLSKELSLLNLDKVSLRNAGGKAFGLKVLKEISKRARPGFRVPASVVLPFGSMECALESDKHLRKKFESEVKALQNPEGEAEILRSIREIMESISLSGRVTRKALEIFEKERPLIVRSSSNSEDMAAFAGAGLYDSVLNVAPDELEAGIKRVFASLWSERAVRARRRAGFPGDKAHMAVVIQEMFCPEISFVIHTVNPVTGNAGEVYMEVALGHGEILTSLTERGVPFRVSVSKKSGEIHLTSYSSFSAAFLPDKEGWLSKDIIDYSRVPFYTDSRFRGELISQMAKTGVLLEKHFGGPQDIEGFVKGSDIYIVQSRNQHLQ